jgi:hypothetical protein
MKTKGSFNLFASLQAEAKAELVALKKELAEQSKDAYELSMLKAAQDFLDARNWSRARGILEIHAKRFPNSCVKATREEWLAFIPGQVKLEKQAQGLRVKVRGATFTGKELQKLETQMTEAR